MFFQKFNTQICIILLSLCLQNKVFHDNSNSNESISAQTSFKVATTGVTRSLNNQLIPILFIIVEKNELAKDKQFCNVDNLNDNV